MNLSEVFVYGSRRRVRNTEIEGSSIKISGLPEIKMLAAKRDGSLCANINGKLWGVDSTCTGSGNSTWIINYISDVNFGRNSYYYFWRISYNSNG